METEQRRALLLYDGLCGLCNGVNRFVLARDTRQVFEFASLQSATGRALLTRFGLPDVLTTLYVVADHRSPAPVVLAKASAVLFIAKALGPPWSWFGICRLLPSVVLNWGYDLVARHRYRLFGRSDFCEIPAPDVRSRFLDV